MGRLLEGFGVGIISYTVTFWQTLHLFGKWWTWRHVWYWFLWWLFLGTRVYRRGFATKHERNLGIREPGLVLTWSLLPILFCYYHICWSNVHGLVFFILQLSVTIGIMLAYLLGLFVNWRLLAVLGKLPNISPCCL